MIWLKIPVTNSIFMPVAGLMCSILKYMQFDKFGGWSTTKDVFWFSYQKNKAYVIIDP